MNEAQAMPKGLMRTVISRFVGGFLILGALFFLPAGTFDYWQAWLYLLILFVPVAFMMVWLIRNDPALLERRMRTRERESPQRLVVALSFIWFLLIYVIPPFDRRFGWSHMPAAVSIGAAVVVLLGYLVVIAVFRQNSYASRVVEVERQQKVISTGLYGVVRHPMYLGVTIMYTVTPLALGSWWALIAAPLIVASLAVRILNEEQLLQHDLPGYAAYMQQHPWRLVPGVW